MSNDKFISIPPYISTSWKNIRALRMEDTHLIITLTDGSVVRVPNLNEDDVKNIFSGHASYLQEEEQKETPQPKLPPQPMPFSDAVPFRFGMGPEGLAQGMQHDSSQSGAPNLPPEILEKVASIGKILSPGDSSLLPKPEHNCNCVHCQIARAMGAESEETSDVSDETEETEEVSEDDLRFREWDIEEIGDQIYQVRSPLSPEEIFRVCLSPPGCTCGKSNCAHLLAVLRS